MTEMLTENSLKTVASQQKYYVAHLAEVNKSNDVISIKDIYNNNGMLVVRKGVHINHEIAERIIQHRLLQPLEEQVQLENALNDSQLNDGFKSLMDKYPDVMQIHNAYKFQDTLDILLKDITHHSILLQELTVMNECLPGEFEKALFCSWLSALIAKEMAMNENLIHVAFLSGISHDMGLLHISPDILHKQETLTPGEWRSIQSHVVIGHLLLDKIYGKNSLAAKAVLEHHERCDGSGYPGSKTDSKLEIMGQVIGMADSLQAIRLGQFSKSGRNLRDATPYLNMNSHTHFLAVYNAMCSILKKSGLKATNINPFGDIRSLIKHSLDQAIKLRRVVTLLDQELDLNGLDKKNNSFAKLVKVAAPVLKMIRASGMAKGEIIEWLKSIQINSDETVITNLTELELMQNELRWQLKKVCKVINEYKSNDFDPVDSEQQDNLSILAIQMEMFLSS